MRIGFHPDLIERLHRADPAARLMAQLVTVARADVKRLKGDWIAEANVSAFDKSDPFGAGTDFVAFVDGSAALAPASAAVGSSTTTDGAYLTELDGINDGTGAEEYFGILVGFPEDIDLTSARFTKFKAKIHRQLNGANTQFNGGFLLRIFAYTEWWYEDEQGAGVNYLDWVSLTELAAGLSAADMVKWADDMATDEEVLEWSLFDEGAHFWVPPFGAFPFDGNYSNQYWQINHRRYLLFHIQIVPERPNGEVASVTGVDNVGWAADGSLITGPTIQNPQTGTDSDKIWFVWARQQNKEISRGEDMKSYGYFNMQPLCEYVTEQQFFKDGDVGWVYYQLEREQYADPAGGYKTLEVDLDLGAAPASDTDLEIRFEDVAPEGAESVCEISSNGGTNWYECTDGDLIGVNNIDSGNDLSSVARQQTYKMRWRVKSNTGVGGKMARSLSPKLYEMGVIELDSHDISDLIEVGAASRMSVDPLTLEPSVGETQITVVRDGVHDFNDIITRLVATSSFNDIELRLFVGASDLPRYKWAHVDTFRVDDLEPTALGVRFRAVSVLERLKGLIPPANYINNKRTPKVYDRQTIKAAMEDVVDTQIGLTGRYRGQLSDTAGAYTVSKTLYESDGLEEVGALAYVDDRAVISSQGKVKVVPVHGSIAVAEVIPRDQVQILKFDPGFRLRQPEYFMRFGFDLTEPDTFEAELRRFNAPALAVLGRARIEDEPLRPPEAVERWLEYDVDYDDSDPPQFVSKGTGEAPASYLGDKKAKKITTWFGTGMHLMQVETLYAYPWLEIGDAVAVFQDTIVLKDSISGDEIKGPKWVIGIIVEQYDHMGTQFLLWIRSLSLLFTDAVGLGRPVGVPVLWIEQQRSQSESANVVFRIHAWPETDTNIYYVAQAASAAIPERAKDGTGWTQLTANGEFDPITVARHSTENKRLCVYGVHNGQMSPIYTVIIGPNLEAEITDSTVQESGNAASGLACVKRTVDVDTHTKKVRVYRRRDNWPTTDASQTGPLDEQYYKGELDAVTGYVFEDCGYSTNDVIYDIWVPVDRDGIAGAREEYSYTVVDTPTPRFVTIDRSIGTNGTACTPETSQRSCVISWTTDDVTPGSHQVLIYIWWGAWWELVATVDALTGSPETIYFNTYKGVGGVDPVRDQDVKVRLKPTSGPDDDLRILPENRSPFYAKTCDAWPE